MIPPLWNCLPDELKAEKSFETFHKRILELYEQAEGLRPQLKDEANLKTLLVFTGRSGVPTE